MTVNSINTNSGAMIALQNLNSTASDLRMTQQRISTGKKIGSAKDNGAIWAMSKTQSANAQSLNAVKDSLQRGQSTIDVALAAGDTITDLLGKMKEKALAASDTSLNTASFNALKSDFDSLYKQITKAATNSKFNGASLATGSVASMVFLANSDGSGLTVTAQTLTVGGLGLSATPTFASRTSRGMSCRGGIPCCTIKPCARSHHSTPSIAALVDLPRRMSVHDLQLWHA